MPTLIPAPTIVQAAGTRPKRIEEYAGRVNSGDAHVSVARMISPEGCEEPKEWARYASPAPCGPEYVPVCLPAFSPATVHRDE